MGVIPPLFVGLAVLVFGATVFYVFLLGLFWGGAGYSPTGRRQLEAAASLLQLKEGDTVYDLGSGFGKALLFFAKRYKVSVVGVEIEPMRCSLSRWRANREGVSDKVRVVRGNLLDTDLSRSSKVFFFLSPLLMRRVQEKVGREMPEGSRVVSVDHRFPDWEAAQTVDNVHLYIVTR